jgi:histidinol-phosphate aminotransferase
MPESARAAIARALGEAARYPDSNAFDLKAALAGKYGVPENWLTLGNGSNDILVLAAQAFLQPGAGAVYSAHAFIVYALASQMQGAQSSVVPALPGLGHDLEGMLSAIRPNTQLVFIANPNNPTGTFLTGEAIESFLGRVPSRVMVLLDEAYNEYLDPELRVDSSAWVRRYPNLIVSRTFSKAYGLAGLRVGYAIAQASVTDVLNRIRQPFNVNGLALAAAAAALTDQEFLERTYAMNRAGYRQLTEAFDALGLRYIPSRGNFVLVQVGEADDAGARVNLGLLKQGVIVRPVDNYGLSKWIRISIGLPEENSALIAALPQALQS